MKYTYALLPWKECTDLGFGTAETRCIGLCQTSNDTIVVLTQNGSSYWGVARSLDRGVTWQDHYLASNPDYMMSIAAYGSTVYAVGYDGSNQGYYFKSTDHGASWTKGVISASPAVGRAWYTIQGSDTNYYLAADEVYYSADLVTWNSTSGWGAASNRFMKGGIIESGSTMYAFGTVSGPYNRIWKATTPTGTWSIMENDFPETLYASCIHNGSVYAGGRSASSPYDPVLYKLVGSTWTSTGSFPVTGNDEAIHILTSFTLDGVNYLFAWGGTAASNGGYNTYISKDDGETWWVTGLDFLEQPVTWHADPTSCVYDSAGHNIFVPGADEGEGRVYQAAINALLTPYDPTNLSVSPIGGGKIISVDTPFTEDFSTDLSNWTVSKKLGTEDASITSRTGYINKELVLDLPDSADTEVSVTSSEGLPNSLNWEIDLKLYDYSPDNTTNGFNVYLKVTDGSGDNNFIVIARETGGYCEAQVSYQINAGGQTTLGTVDESYWSTAVIKRLKIKREYNTLSGYVFVESGSDIRRWFSIGYASMGSYAGHPVYVEIGAYDNATRGGSVCIDSLTYQQENSIYYDSNSGVTKLTGSKIESKTLPYLHIYSGHDYYVATTENFVDESGISNEDDATSTIFTRFRQGPIVNFNESETRMIRSCKINDDVVAVNFLDFDTNSIRSIVYNISGRTPIEDATAEIVTDVETGSTVYLDCCTATDDKWIIVYREASSNELKILLLSWSTGTITNHGNQLGTTVTTPTYISCGQSQDNKIWASWANSSAADFEMIVGNVSGSSISFGSVYDLDTASVETQCHSCTVNSSEVFSAYQESSEHKGVRATITGTVVTNGSERVSVYDELSLETHNYSECCAPKSDRVIVAYDYNEPYARGERIGRFQIVSDISSSQPTWGKPYVFKNESVRNCRFAVIDEDHIAIAYQNVEEDRGEVIIFEVDWDNDTFTPLMADVFESGSVGGYGDRGLGITLSGDRTLVISYQDETDSSKGKITVLSFHLPGDLPDAPQNLHVSAGEFATTSTWDSVTDADYYNLYYDTTAGVDTTSGIKIEGVTSPYIHTVPEVFIRYYYIVTAVEEGVESLPSSVASAVPWGGLPRALDTTCEITTDCTATISLGQAEPLTSSSSIVSYVAGDLGRSPDTPLNLTGTITAVDEVTLTWTSVSDATSYILYWSNSPGVTIATGTPITGITGTSYAHGSLDTSLTYYYVVVAINESGDSPESEEFVIEMQRYGYFTYSPMPADLSLILDGLLNNLSEPISYEAITQRPSSRSDRKDRLDDLASYFSESVSNQFLYGVSSVSSMLESMNPNLKSAIDALFATEEGDVAISNLLRTLDGWITDTDNIGPDAPNIEIVLRGLGSSEQSSILSLVNFFKPYRSRLVFIGSTFSIDNKLTESVIVEDDYDYEIELSFGYDSTSFPEYRADETVSATDDYEIEEEVEITEMVNWHTADSTTGHYLSYELVTDSTSEIETVLISDGFWDFDDEGAYFDVPFGSDIVTIEVT